VIKVKLKELLKEKDKTLLSLARETGISYNTLHKIKKNDVQSMSFDVLEKICKNLKCSTSDLLAIEE
jgi:putative transcriptional regulator